MSLLAPTQGEIADRLSILFRRLVERKVVEQDNSASREEAAALFKHLWPDSLQEQIEVRMHIGFLFAVNAALWERENLLRGTTNTLQLAALVLETSKLNDWRARLIAAIDNGPDAPSPKIHRS